MIELAQRHGDGLVLTRTLADTQGLSQKYLQNLLASLKSGGLVHSVRGPGGGFVLTRSPDQITVYEILRTLEGPPSLVECVTDEAVCEKSSSCAARRFWQRLSDLLRETLENVTLASMLDDKTRTSGPKTRDRKR